MEIYAARQINNWLNDRLGIDIKHSDYISTIEVEEGTDREN